MILFVKLIKICFTIYSKKIFSTKFVNETNQSIDVGMGVRTND
jgi:hypothetical protein